MKEKLKEYCFEELLNIRRGWDAERAICRAQGAVMFYTNHAKDEPEEDREEIRAWWNEKMLYSMMMEKKKTERGEIMKEYFFEFSGTWTWGCYASSLEEAKKTLEDEGYDELDISDPVMVDKYCDAGKIETYAL